ncbi:MAG: alginate export family protein [Bacteroidota bacterium]|nr:alginate export family protein [Bacteroidota bacterium]
MKNFLLISSLVTFLYLNRGIAQTSSTNFNSSDDVAHSVLPIDGVITYLPDDTTDFNMVPTISSRKVEFTPTINFFFRPESTINYKEAGMPEDTGQLNFYLRGDVGAKLSLPKDIEMVVNLQSYGLYTRSLGPLDPNLSLYEAYVDMKRLDRAGKLSLRFGRMCLGKYGTEIIVGDDDFIKGRSFESVRLRYKTKRSTSDLMWVQLYQAAPDSANFDWNHPIFLGNFNTFQLSESFAINANLIFIIDQYNSGYRTSALMPDVRFFGQSGNLKYSVEAILQTGSATGILNDNIDGSLSAHAFEVGLGYVTNDEKVTADVAFYRASGDDDLSDDKIRSYNVLWQNEHRRFGYIDAFKGSNLQAATFHLNWNIGRLLATGIHAVYASVLEPHDRSTGVSTGPVNNLNTDNKALGIGGDFYLNYYFSHNLNMQLSASVFSPGEYFTAVNGIEDTMVRMYLLLALRI